MNASGGQGGGPNDAGVRQDDGSGADQPRFAFGQNWASFLRHVDQHRAAAARQSLIDLLGRSSLHGTRFLDLGCGSGLFSLAAIALGAQVVSVDIDPDSVACAETLRKQYAGSVDPQAAGRWNIHAGSVLDADLMRSLGHFDVVYSWGVLHHTGRMVEAIDAAASRVAAEGILAIAIYNDQGGASRRWRSIKRAYHRLPGPLRKPYVATIAAAQEARFALIRLFRGQNPLPAAGRGENPAAGRGMNAWHDWVDWVGGYPFEVAKPEEIILPLRRAGFVLQHLTTVTGGWGCNEYVFRKEVGR